MPYSGQTLGTSLSVIVQKDDEQDSFMRTFEVGSTEPTVREPGVIWFCTDSARIVTAGGPASQTLAALRWTGSAWAFVAIVNSPLLSANGAVALTGDLPMGTHKLTGLSAGSAAGHSVRYEQVLLLNGSNGGWTGNQNANGNKIINLAAPTLPSDAARLADVAVPAYVGRTFYNTNFDAASLGSPATVKQQQDGGTQHCVTGFVPREITFRIKGKFRKQAGNGVHLSGDPEYVREFTVRRWADQSTNGDAGTPTVVVQDIVPSSGGVGVYAIIEWRTTAGSEGFYLRFRNGASGGSVPDGGDWLQLRNASNVSVDGVVHALVR